MRKREIEKRRPEQEQHRVMGNIEMNFVAYALTSDNILAPWSVVETQVPCSLNVLADNNTRNAYKLLESGNRQKTNKQAKSFHNSLMGIKWG